MISRTRRRLLRGHRDAIVLTSMLHRYGAFFLSFIFHEYDKDEEIDYSDLPRRHRISKLFLYYLVCGRS